jgi:hypothetical protein
LGSGLATVPTTAESSDAELLMINRHKKDNKTRCQQATYVGLWRLSYHPLLALQRCWIRSPSLQEKVISAWNENELVPVYAMSLSRLERHAGEKDQGRIVCSHRLAYRLLLPASRAILHSHATHTLEGAALRIKNALYHYAVHIQSIPHYLACLPKHLGLRYVRVCEAQDWLMLHSCRGNGCKRTDIQTMVNRENAGDG